MDDSYYGEAKSQGGRHAKHAAADATDAREVTESPAIDEAVEAVEGAASGEAATAKAASGEAAGAAEATASAATAKAATAKAAADKLQKAAGTGKKKRSPWSIVFIVALIVFICSMIALALIAFSYCQGQQKYDAVARDAGLDITEIEDPTTLEVDWDALLAVNPDTVAWVYVPNTVINYPVVQGQDNEHYLTYDFDGAEGWLANYGAIFLDYRNAPDFSDKANFIYGHHMNDGSMFAELASFDNQDRFDECRTVYLLTPKTNYRLRTFALLHVDGTEELVQNVFADDDEFTEYVQDKIDRSVVNVGNIPNAKDMGRIFAFATCDDYGSGRYVLYAYIEDEKASGLSGTVGLSQEDGETVGFEDDLSTESDEAAGSDETAEDGQESEQDVSDGSEQSGEE